MSMLIPISDLNPYRRFPIVTVLLIAANVLVFFAVAQGFSITDSAAYQYGAVPCDVHEPLRAALDAARQHVPGTQPAARPSSRRCSCTRTSSTSGSTCCSSGSSGTTSRTASGVSASRSSTCCADSAPRSRTSSSSPSSGHPDDRCIRRGLGDPRRVRRPVATRDDHLHRPDRSSSSSSRCARRRG